MNGKEGKPFAQKATYWLEGDSKQNFGDYLSWYFSERLFVPIPRLTGEVRLVGSCLADGLFASAMDQIKDNDFGIKYAVTAWGVGVREPGSLSPEYQSEVDILSLRGNHSANELRLGASVPTGDPGLLMPALYTPSMDTAFSERCLCIPHFHDARTDLEIVAVSGADLVLRPAIPNALEEVENFIDRLTSAEFVLCGSLHAAIIAAAYGVPFAFWDSGKIDLPFKWQDFADSINIPCEFAQTVDAGRQIYESQIKGNITLPSMWPMLAAAPYPIRPEALISLLAADAHRLALNDISKINELKSIFARTRRQQHKFVDECRNLTSTLWDRYKEAVALLPEAKNRAATLEHENDEIKRVNEELVRENEALRAIEDELRREDKNRASDQRTYLQEVEKYREDHQKLAEALGLAERRVAFMQEKAEELAFGLYKAYRRPMRPIKYWLIRLMLRIALMAKPILSKKRVKKFRQSLRKRRPKTILSEWNDVKEAVNASEALSRTKLADTAHSLGLPDLMDPKKILVIDYRLPQPDVSAGEKASFGMLEDLVAVGFDVTFIPINMQARSPYLEALEKAGVKVVTRKNGFEWVSDYLRLEGHRFGVFYVFRLDVFEQTIEHVRKASPAARVIFHAPDLHFLREFRGAEITGASEELKRAENTKLRELAVMRAADHNVLVSPAELPYLVDEIAAEKFSVFPALYSPIDANPAGFAEREHLFFLGGFGHPPNVDAVLWFTSKIWPTIHAALPDVEFHILGAEAPQEIKDLDNEPGIRFVGFVDDIESTMARYRLAVAPLTYGAGIKGKVGASMGCGVPTICTSIAAEGMCIENDIHTFVADEPDAFAEAVIKLYPDQELWNRFSRNGRRLVEENFGGEANRSSFLRALDEAKVLPLDLIVSYCQNAPNISFPQYDESQTIDVSIIIPVYNKWSLTRACLVSVGLAGKACGITYEVILADDGSTDETLAASNMFPGLRVERTSENMGFLGNCNNAAATARGRHLLFLNNDTVVMPNWLTALYSRMATEPDAAIVGSKLLYPDGRIQEGGGLLYSDATAANYGRYKDRFDESCAFPRETDYITGASFLVNGSFWRSIGGFDERYKPAYCEESDLALAARSRGLRVLYEPGSEVLHFEKATYGHNDENETHPLILQNNKKLLEKWSSVFASDHLPAGTEPAIAAAFADRHANHIHRVRRGTGHLNILYFSPFPSHPDSHGNQATIQSFGRRLQALGHKVHFALLESNMYDDEAFSAMQAAWDSFDILPNTHPLGANGEEIPFDSWYEEGLGQNVRKLCVKYDIDVVFCSYIFQSRLLEYVPRHILKVIDTHDKMGGRYEMLRKNKQKLEFFSCTPEQEGTYLQRADFVVARRREEADYFNSVSGRDSAVVIPHFEEAHFTNRSFTSLRNVGLVASANRVNLAILCAFMQALKRKLGGRECPFKLHIAGQIKGMVSELPPQEAALFSERWVEMHGFVPDIGDFYNAIDLLVSPVTMGTGINVKTVQAMAYGMPLITTAWGSKGIETGEPLHGHENLDQLCDSLMQLAADPAPLNKLAAVSRRRYEAFYQTGLDAMVELMSHVKDAESAGNER